MEEKLLKLLLKNPEKGLEKIMDEYVSLVYSVVKKKIGSSFSNDIIEDIVTDSFIKLYENKEKIDLKRGSIKNYICLIAKRETIDFLRAKNSERKYLDNEKMEFFDASFETEDIVNKEYLKQCLGKLKIEDRLILLRKYYYGQKSEEIAKEMNMKTNTVDKRVSRGLKKLKKIMEVSYG